MLMTLIDWLMYTISFRLMLRKLRVLDGNLAVDTFEYKGKHYDKVKYIQLKLEDFANSKVKNLEKGLASWEKSLIKSKNPEFDKANIDAIKIALENKEAAKH